MCGLRLGNWSRGSGGVGVWGGCCVYSVRVDRVDAEWLEGVGSKEPSWGEGGRRAREERREEAVVTEAVVTEACQSRVLLLS